MILVACSAALSAALIEKDFGDCGPFDNDAISAAEAEVVSSGQTDSPPSTPSTAAAVASCAGGGADADTGADGNGDDDVVV